VLNQIPTKILKRITKTLSLLIIPSCLAYATIAIIQVATKPTIELEEIFRAVVALLILAAGFLLNRNQRQIDKLEEKIEANDRQNIIDHSTMEKERASIRETFVSKSEMNGWRIEIINRLDRIEQKIH